MLSGKLALSFNDEVNLKSNITPLNSPTQFINAPNNTPQISPLERTTGSLEALTHRRLSLVAGNFTLSYTDFQDQLIQKLSNKFPENNTPKERDWNIPLVTLSPVKEARATEDNNYIGHSQNIPGRNNLSLSRSFSEFDLMQNSPFSDQMSTLATQGSGVDSLSEFELSFTKEEMPDRERSLSLGDIESSDGWSDFRSKKQVMKVPSVDDFQEVLFNFDE